MTNHLKQTAAGVMVLLVNLQMLGKLVDTGGEQSNLNLRRTCITFVSCIGFNYLLLSSLSIFYTSFKY